MKRFQNFIFLCIILLLVGCRQESPKNQKQELVTVSISLDKENTNNNSIHERSNSTDYSGINSVLITAVEADVSSVSNGSIFAALSQAMQNMTDNTVTLTIPINTSIRLVQSGFASSFSLKDITGSEVSNTIGLSDAFLQSHRTGNLK